MSVLNLLGVHLNLFVFGTRNDSVTMETTGDSDLAYSRATFVGGLGLAGP